MRSWIDKYFKNRRYQVAACWKLRLDSDSNATATSVDQNHACNDIWEDDAQKIQTLQRQYFLCFVILENRIN